MSNFDQALHELETYAQSGAVFIIVQTGERYRAERLFRRFVSRQSFSRAFYYTQVHQVMPLDPYAQVRQIVKKKKERKKLNPTSESSPVIAGAQGIDVNDDPLTWARSFFRQNTRSLFILADTQPLDRDTLFARELLDTIYLAKETSNTIVLVASGPIWSALTRFGFVIDLGLPDEQERRTLIDALLEQSPSAQQLRDDKNFLDEIVASTGGLSEVQVENLVRSYLLGYEETQERALIDVIGRKEALFALPPAITRVTYDNSMPIAGLTNLRQWLSRKKSVFFAPSAQLKERHLQAPKGVLLMGVPGCGKSFSAKVLAHEWGLPLYRLDFSAIYNKYVGETERLMRETLEYLDNVSPCIVWIDEIEKVMASKDSNSEVDRRVLAQFLFWLQESTSRVFLIATANNPDSLPDELMRRGRFSEIFFIDLPNGKDRLHAISMYASQAFKIDYRDEKLNDAVAHTEGFSFSDIHHIIRDIAEEVEFEGRDTPNEYELAKVFAKATPSGVSQDTVANIRKWAQDHSAIPASGQGE